MNVSKSQGSRVIIESRVKVEGKKSRVDKGLRNKSNHNPNYLNGK